MNIDYTIGDDIICVESHSKKAVKEGEFFECLAIQKRNCCQGAIVDVGIRNLSIFSSCNCGRIYDNKGIIWIDSTLFKKLDTLVDISELTEILENTVPFEL